MKSTLTLLLTIVATFSIISCHKKDDDSGSSLKVKIIGTWDEQIMYIYHYTNGKLVESDTTISQAGDYTKFTFKSDNTVSAEASSNGQVETSQGTYSLSGNKLTLVGIDPEDQSKDTSVLQCDINGSQMIWTEEATLSSTAGGTEKFGVKIHFTKE